MWSLTTDYRTSKIYDPPFPTPEEKGQPAPFGTLKTKKLTCVRGERGTSYFLPPCLLPAARAALLMPSGLKYTSCESQCVMWHVHVNRSTREHR